MQYRLTFLFLLLAVCAPAYLSAQYPDYGKHKNHKTSWTENDGTKVELRVRVTNDDSRDDDAAIDAVQIWTDATGTVIQRKHYVGRIDCFLDEFQVYGNRLLHPEDFPQLFKLVC